MTDTFPVLYVLMRNDIPSMNPGKAMIQACHASNSFIHYAQTALPLGSDENDVDAKVALVDQWQRQTKQGFGTGLSLTVNEVQMRTAVKIAQTMGFLASVVTDPTYPYQTTAELMKLIDPALHTLPPVYNGDQATGFRSEDTCAYIFGDKNDPLLAGIVGRFPLHP